MENIDRYGRLFGGSIPSAGGRVTFEFSAVLPSNEKIGR
jgi:hypothetical protein